MTKWVNLHGLSVGIRTAQEGMVNFIDSHSLSPVVQKVFAMSEAKAAYAAHCHLTHLGKT
jgi:NADPH:quinone reductase-like Zn-dependent oxidoreductase